jgi:UDP-N-acetylglucosamine--N-acetylmuramyl-(pentapeptide) pyrophosphoryl-undecaprenol N-acetylglucosamine transferase
MNQAATTPNSPYRVVVTGGGTGGHITPALAVADALRAQGVEVTYVGNPKGLEQAMAPERGYPFYGVEFSGMPRKPGVALLKWFFQLFTAARVARQHLRRIQPHAVFGTGGYVAAPVLLAAKSLGIPYAIHEADAYPGLVNRLTARWAQHVTIAFEQAKKRLPIMPIHLTGNPVRQDLGLLTQREACARLWPDWLPLLPPDPDNIPPDNTQPANAAQGLPVVLVMGGSQGARQINRAVVGALPHLLPHALVVHQTGKQLFDETMALVPPVLKNDPHYSNYRPMPFIADMSAMLALANVAVCRSGSLTLSELFVAGVPAILVPYPYAAGNHQLINAQSVQSAGAAIIIEDSHLTSEHLVEILYKLLQSVDLREPMVEAAKKLAKPHATATITHLLCGLFGAER